MDELVRRPEYRDWRQGYDNRAAMRDDDYQQRQAETMDDEPRGSHD